MYGDTLIQSLSPLVERWRGRKGRDLSAVGPIKMTCSSIVRCPALACGPVLGYIPARKRASVNQSRALIRRAKSFANKLNSSVCTRGSSHVEHRRWRQSANRPSL